jgi:hypothetical protein
MSAIYTSRRRGNRRIDHVEWVQNKKQRVCMFVYI